MESEKVKNRLRLGYGSEFHLLRMLGRHRARFNREVARAIGTDTQMEWFDFPFCAERIEHYDKEYSALDFLECINLDPAEENLRYHEYWPETGKQHWDLTGKTDDGRLILVEAKANLQEIESSTGARSGLQKIEYAFDKARTSMGITRFSPWTSRHYQLANHIFTCWYLNEVRHIPALLLNVYFVGDARPDATMCPQSADEWVEAVKKEYEYLGISSDQPFINEHVKSCFIHVDGRQL
jgi:hypothetical protein